MYLDKVYIRCREGEIPDSVNNFAAYDGFRQLGAEIVPFYGFGDVEEIKDFGPNVGISGYLVDIWLALKTIQKPKPTPIDYPEELTDYLGRSIKSSTLGEVRKILDPIFVKPKEDKLFTGYLTRMGDGDRNSVLCPDDTEVWTSDLVKFVTEYRVFVMDSKIIGAHFYKGNWGIVPNRDIIESAVKAFTKAPRGYSLDFGVTDDGKTLLVEANDGYALGNYGLNSVLYARLIEARWEELTR